MKIHLARVEGVPAEYSCVPVFSEQLRHQREPGRHHEVEDASAADVVLFTECHLLPEDWRLRRIVSSEVARRHPDKVAVYNERDRPWCRLPGIYVSMPRSGFVPRWQVAGSYWRVDSMLERLGAAADQIEQDLLYSFVGATTHPCREAIFALRSERSYLERTDGFMFYDAASDRFQERRHRFSEVMLRSKFVLCPRGHGTASFRLYETLRAGRVPVVVADAWVPPSGPDWDDFSIRWPESRVAELPGELERREHEALEMGSRAKAAFDRWFAQDVVMLRQLDQLEALLGAAGRGRFPRFGYWNAQYLRTWRGSIAGSVRRQRDRAGKHLFASSRKVTHVTSWRRS